MKMDRRVIFVITSLLAALLSFLAVGYNGLGCDGSILDWTCITSKVNKTTGALLLTAGLLIFLAGIILILMIAMGDSWTEIGSAVVAAITIPGVIYYLYAIPWNGSQFLAVIAMIITVGLACAMIIDLIKSS